MQQLPGPHETRTESGITIPDPDQGTPYVHIQCAMPSTSLMIWEPFSAEQIEAQPELAKFGHNLHGFAERWAAWKQSRDLFLEAIDPRFGFPKLIPRECIPQAVELSIQYHRQDDVRAPVRSLAVAGQPSVRALGNNTFEIGIPTGARRRRG